MGLPKITFIRKQGLGRRQASNDGISGLLFYSATLPSGFTTTERVKKIFSIGQAQALGIVDTHADETKASGGNVLITQVGAAGSIETIILNGVILGSYVVTTGDTVDIVASAQRAAINENTAKHGITAGGAAANVAITLPSKIGIAANASTLVYSSTGAGTGTVTQFSGGVASKFASMHYHISEFFRINENGVLYVGIYDEPTIFDGAEISLMQNAANGEIRQLSIDYTNATFASSQLSVIQTVLTTLRSEKKNLLALYHADMSSLTISTLPNLSTLTASKVATLLGEDGNFHQLEYSATKSYIQGDKVKWLNKTYICTLDNTGEAPYNASYYAEVSVNLPDILGKSVSTIGATLGTVSIAPVNESIAYVEKYPLNFGDTLDVAAFATGDLYKNLPLSQLNTLTDYHYIFLRKFQDFSGTYHNDSWTGISQSNDYATIENNRVMDKVERLQNVALTPKLNAPLFVNSDGTLRRDTIDVFEDIADNPIEGMQIAGEISERSVIISPDQDVITTSKLIITTKIIPVGVLREIEGNNEFTVKI